MGMGFATPETGRLLQPLPGIDDNLDCTAILDLKFTTCFSFRGSFPGAAALTTPPASADAEATTPFGPCLQHSSLMCFVLHQVG